MKKIFTFFAALCAMGTVMAQTIVSTQPQNRNVVIEEVTGVNCQYCPDGHRIVNEIIDANPGRVVGINVHQGGYANGSGYTTQYGDALANQTGLDGYPAGTVNRHVFTGSNTSLSRSAFAQASNIIMDLASPVNMAAVGSIDPATRTMTVHVEIYYTATSNNGVNFLNIAILQNNIMGQQVGASTWYPEMVENGQYRHMHMLRDLLTGQWGQQINATEGTFIDTTIVYTIPNAIGSVAIPDVNDIDMVVFVTEGHQEILTGVKATIITEVPSLGKFKAVRTSDCGFEYQPSVTINNTTVDTLDSFTFQYDGASYTRNKIIYPFTSDTINLPAYTVVMNSDPVQNCATTKTVSLLTCETYGGEILNVNSPEKSVTFAEFQKYNADGPFYLDLVLDRYGKETHAYWTNQSNCNDLWHTPTFSNISMNRARHYYFNIDPAEAGMYIFRVTDDYGDGATYTGNNENGFTLYSLKDGDTTLVLTHDGDYGTGMEYVIITSTSGSGNYVGIEDVADVKFSVYPNPTTDRLNISCSEAVREVSVIDITGRTVINAGTERTVNVSGLATGVYMVRIATENGIGMQKFVKE